MDTSPPTVVARVPVAVLCLDADGRPVSPSAPTLARGSTGLQDLVHRVYTGIRGEVPGEAVTVSFQEVRQGALQLEYLVVDRARGLGRRWLRGARHGDAAQTALTEAATVVFATVTVISALGAATSARWADTPDPEAVDLVLDGAAALRVPRAVPALLRDGTALQMVRDPLAPFSDGEIEQMIITKDTGAAGDHDRVVVTRTPGLVRFVEGGPVAPLPDSGTAAPERPAPRAHGIPAERR
ncbi:hypothetical protein ACH9EU_05480 [Kocuria sp. M1R5S2]|uniref:hypothetical protein n=1 Tax=Kocuria rhizosphaerae TaxID=3376285 RepID=UPI00379F4210